MRLFSAILLTALIAAPLAAAEESKEQAPPKKEKRICRTAEPTGSRLVLRTCHTQSEWDVIDKQQQEHADREMTRVDSMARSDGSGFSPN